MDIMNMPGFNAEASLYRTGGRYQTDRHAINSFREKMGMVYAAETRGEEVINVHSCPPGYIEVGSGDDAFCTEGPGSWWDGMGGGTGPPDVPPGGGGGGGTPADDKVPKTMDTECVKENFHCAGNSDIRTCAWLKCRIDYCGPDDKKCTDPGEEKKRTDAKFVYDEIKCKDLPPCVKPGTRSSIFNRGVRRFQTVAF
jgi:hypothetical protein